MKEWIELFDKYKTKKVVADELGISRPTLDLKLRMSGFDYKEYKAGKYKIPKKKTIHKVTKNKIFSMNDIYEWLIANPDNVIALRMMTENKNNRTVWKDQYSKFADFLSIINLIK